VRPLEGNKGRSRFYVQRYKRRRRHTTQRVKPPIPTVRASVIMKEAKPELTNGLALIVGAGAVENSWAPVLRALQHYYEFPLTADGANSVLARIVYLLRWYASTNNEVELAATKQFLVEVRSRICEELRIAEATNEITIRQAFYRIIDRFVTVRTNKLMFVTTNWDTVAETALRAYLNPQYSGDLYPLHVHGSVATDDVLYLPTEVTRELYRSPDEDQRIGKLHGTIWRGLEKARWVVIYGLSLSPLDAELAQTLAAGWSNPLLERIDVIVPDHSVVAHRINLLFDERTITVNGYDPDHLDAPVDYTVSRSKPVC
jgi:hypothetical protein